MIGVCLSLKKNNIKSVENTKYAALQAFNSQVNQCLSLVNETGVKERRSIPLSTRTLDGDDRAHFRYYPRL